MPLAEQELALQLATSCIAHGSEMFAAFVRGDFKCSAAMVRAWGDTWREVDEHQADEEVAGALCNIIAMICEVLSRKSVEQGVQLSALEIWQDIVLIYTQGEA
jgi:hypothetical protein